MTVTAASVPSRDPPVRLGDTLIEVTLSVPAGPDRFRP
jgi:hypothetical protein